MRDLFDRIAPAYGLFYEYQKRRYRAVLELMQQQLNLADYNTVIDVGCGTGALCAVLQQRGFTVTGVDSSPEMLEIAKRKTESKTETKTESNTIQFLEASILTGLPFPDKSFDFSIASYVAHGMRAEERRRMYAEMSRITKNLVIIYDYNEKRSILTDLAEWLENGDYFNFIKAARREMSESFKGVRVIPAGRTSFWYVCYPKQ